MVGLLSTHHARPNTKFRIVSGVADQRLVAPLQLLIEGLDNGAAVGGVLLGFGLVAAHDVAPALGLDLLDEELGLRAPGPLDTERREGLLVREHHGANQAVGALAGTQHVFEAALFEGGPSFVARAIARSALASKSVRSGTGMANLPRSPP